MKQIKILILFLFISDLTYSQTIINAERLSNIADSTIYAFSLSYNGTRGNSRTDLLNISPAFILMKKRNEYKVFSDYSMLSQSGKKILNSGFVHLRHNFRINDRIKTFGFYQLQFNDVLLLRKRELYGAGLRFSLLNHDSLKFDLGAGVMRESEVLIQGSLLPGEPFETVKYAASFLGSFKWLINKTLKLNNVIYYQPYLKDFGDYKLLNELNLAVTLTNHLDLITSLSTRYDSNPPGVLKNLDNVLSFGLNVKF